MRFHALELKGFQFPSSSLPNPNFDIHAFRTQFIGSMNFSFRAWKMLVLMSCRVVLVFIFSPTLKSAVLNLLRRAWKRDRTFAIYFLKNRESRWVTKKERFYIKMYHFDIEKRTKITKKYQNVHKNVAKWFFHLLIGSLVIEGLSIVVRFYKLWLIYSHNKILNF